MIPVRAGAPGRAVEVATWRPVETVDVDGWAVGRSGGFTRRANSVVTWREPRDVDAALARVEGLYATRGAPSVFRLDVAARPADLGRRLAERGYVAVATTRVLVREVRVDDGDGATTLPPGVVVTAAQAPDESWLDGWLGVKASGRAVDPALARAIVGSSPATYLTARDGDDVVAVVRAARAGGWVGLSCLMVAERARGRGLGASLSGLALADAARRGAGRAFLQVEAENAVAARLYGRLGFVAADEYHYRELRRP